MAGDILHYGVGHGCVGCKLTEVFHIGCPQIESKQSNGAAEVGTWQWRANDSVVTSAAEVVYQASEAQSTAQ